MSLLPGSRIGSFLIGARLGAGGMGEVYLAEDSRLRRRVALKVIAPHLSQDADAGPRLLREARAAAMLEHPNICAVYEVGEADGRGFIAMQYVEGTTLAERMQQSPIELTLALAIAAQIANALAAAHRRGIIHRDIKPQNVMLSAANHATVLDFGLAKTAAPVAEEARTATVLTREGVVTGTWSYMSPEQARAETVDERSDVFSFGIALYELVARVHPFSQDSPVDTLAAILTRDPRPAAVDLPPELRRILRKCLEKDRARRYQTMRDAAIDLENLAQELSVASTGSPVSATPTPGAVRSHTLRTASIVALLAGLGAVTAAAVWWNRGTPPLVESGYEAITEFSDSATAPALSPDGRMITFIRGGPWFLSATGQIYVKMLPNGEAVRLTDDPRPKFGPVFSADGSRVAYTALAAEAGKMSWDTWTVPISGGTPARLLANAAGLSWIDARHVLFSEIAPGATLHMGLVTATEDRRDARQIYFPAHERAMAHFSYPSPDRLWLLVVEMGPLGSFDRCRLLPFDGSSAGRQIGPNGACLSAAWSPDQRWMYFSARLDGSTRLWRQRFPDGAPELLTPSRGVEEQGVAVAPDGRSLVTSIGVRQSALWLHTPAGERLLSSEGHASAPTLSPDGKRVYYLLRRAAASGAVELRVMDLATQKSNGVLPDFSVVDYAVARDEQQVAITARAADGSPEIWVAALDRRTAPRRVVQGGDRVGFGANGELVFRSIEGQVNFVNRIGVDGQHRQRLSDINAIDMGGTSPDGSWVIFAGRAQDDRFAVLVMPVNGGEPRVLCYDACQPDWTPDAATLFLSTGVESPHPILVLRLPAGRAFPEFPAGPADALSVWRKLPASRTIERPTSIPGLDDATYILTRSDEHLNLFRVPLSR